MKHTVIFFITLLCCSTVQAETVLITGSNSGIGLELAKQYAAKDWKVIATHRRDKTPESLSKLSSDYSNVRVEKLDVADNNSIDKLAKKLARITIDVLINNAGIVTIGDRSTQAFGTLDYDQFDLFMHTNVKGPVKMVEAFYEHIKKSDKKKVVMISSLAGSLASTRSNSRVGSYWYKMSKAALNMVSFSLANDMKKDGVSIVAIHPGAVRVERNANTQFPPGFDPISPNESVTGIINVIDGLNNENSGQFIAYDGTLLAF